MLICIMYTTKIWYKCGYKLPITLAYKGIAQAKILLIAFGMGLLF